MDIDVISVGHGHFVIMTNRLGPTYFYLKNINRFLDQVGVVSRYLCYISRLCRPIVYFPVQNTIICKYLSA